MTLTYFCCFQTPWQDGLWMKLRSKCLADSFTAFFFLRQYQQNNSWLFFFFLTIGSRGIWGMQYHLGLIPRCSDLHRILKKKELGKEPRGFPASRQADRPTRWTAVQRCKLSRPPAVFKPACTSVLITWLHRHSQSVRSVPGECVASQCGEIIDSAGKRKERANARGGTTKWAGNTSGEGNVAGSCEIRVVWKQFKF